MKSLKFLSLWFLGLLFTAFLAGCGKESSSSPSASNLSSTLASNIDSYRRTSQEKACESNKKTIENAVEAYLIMNPTASTVTTANLKTQGILKDEPTCPIDGKGYAIAIKNGGTEVTVTCKGSHGDTSSGSAKK